ncbi:MAG: FtsX-like permease family protein [Acidimicrobiia bacterium]|nr:FtsX-like permease family protein [Acidimicrobiia bacterium]
MSAVRVFTRVSLGALWSDRGRTALAVVGVAIGVVVIVGSAILTRELRTPFDTFSAPLAAAEPGTTVLEVRPAVQGALEPGTVDRLREIEDVEAAVPVVADLLPLRHGDAESGALLLGVDCSVEAIIGDFDCETIAPDPSALPTAPVLAMTEPLAADLGVVAGDTVTLPGGDPAGVPIGIVFPAGVVRDVGGGRVVLTASPAVASALLGRGGYLTAAEVVVASDRVDAVRPALTRAVGDAATIDEPAAQLPPALVTVQAALGSVSIGGLMVGIVIAFNSVLLATDRRRGTLATLWAIGATPGRIVGGFLAEGALLGVIGGVLAIPGGFLLGRLLVNMFGNALLAGTGVELSPHLAAADIGVAVGAGLVAGMLAVTPAAVSVVRGGPLASATGVAGSVRIHAVRLWPLPAGLAAVLAGWWVMRAFGRGELPASAAMVGLGLGFLGLLGAVVPLVPLVASAFAAALGRVRPVEGLLAWSDFRRFPRLLAATTVTLAAAAALAGSFASIGALAARSASDAAATVLGDALLVSAQGLWDQRDAAIVDTTAAAVRDVPGATATERRRAVLPSDTEPRIVVGIDPDSTTARRTVASDPSALEGLGPGSVALSTIAASRLGVAAGDDVTLTTANGHATFAVTGVFDPVLADDSTVGDWVVADLDTASDEWAAIRTQMVVEPEPRADLAAIESRLGAIGTVEVFDAQRWRADATAAIGRYFRPFVLNGYLIMLAAAVALLDMLLLGMLERRHERAVLRAVGMEDAQERRTILTQSVVVAIVGAVTAVAVTMLFTWLLSLASVAYYGVAVRWAVVPAAIGAAALVAVCLAVLSAAWPMARASRIEPAAELRAD